MSRIVVIGDVIDDILVTPHGPIRRDTDTESDIVYAQGGSAANVAAWLGHLGAPVDFYGRVGSGDAARHTATLAAHGVRALIEEADDRPTGRIVILLDGDSRTFLNMGGANRDLPVDVLTDERLMGAAAVHITGHSMLEPWRLARVPDLLGRTRRLGIPVVLDPSSAGFLRDVGVDNFLAAVAGVDILLPNRDEAEALTGLDDPEVAARALTAVAPTVIVTCGADGSYVAEDPARMQSRVRVSHVPAEPAHVVDPTGAGDAFAAGFHAAVRRGLSPVDAAAAASTIAARAVTLSGARPPAP
ncbi:PfkB family carbohydrate kinase [Microbacterium sediminicola]|uniref:PfkB family carbohydrate kinase n=1 Tax=Microbacterium sediminicola TaxID=415210 RepID=A0ABN2IFG1_9MICO